MDIREKKFLVIGTGKSGIAAAELLQKEQIAVRLYDSNENLDKQAFYEKNPDLSDVALITGTLPEEEMRNTDILVLSPGVPTDLPMVDTMREMGIAIWGEIELAYAFAKGAVLAITGTNGKTTTTSLLGEIMKNYFKEVFVVGNIGIPYTSVAAETTEESVISCRDQQFPAGNDPYLCTESHSHFKYHTGSLKPPPYDGKLYCGKREHYQKSGSRGSLCIKL